MTTVLYSHSTDRITSQDVLFPIYPRKNEKWTEMVERRKRMQFHINDELLKAWIGWTSQVSGDFKIHGFRQSKHSCGYVMLCTFVRHALGVYRYPFYEDRIIASIHQGSEIGRELEACIAAIDKNRFNAIADEILALYAHTQSKLAEIGVQKVTLTRKISIQDSGIWGRQVDYGQGLYMASQAARILGEKTILLDMDMLNSFGDDDGYAGMPVTLTLDVPTQDVLYCSNLIASANEGDARGDTEPGEWVIINRSPTGVVEIPIDAVTINEKVITDMPQISERTAREFLNSYSPLYIRCGPNMRRLDGVFYGIAYKPTLFQRLQNAWLVFHGRY